MNYQPFIDSDNVAQAVSDRLAIQIKRFLKETNRCHVALPGGSTPAKCLQILAQRDLPWELIHWYVGDERCLPEGDAERNDVMITQNLWTPANIPEANRHTIRGELGAQAAAEFYGELIQLIGNLDIILLGMGEDGHTASLFPDNPALADTRLVVPVFDAPKLPAQRVSLSLTAIQQATERHVIVTGANKRDAMCQLQKGVNLPVSQIGDAHWYVDEAASCL